MFELCFREDYCRANKFIGNKLLAKFIGNKLLASETL